MKLREALDLCSDEHAYDWVEMPGAQSGRPATTMLAGLFDPQMSESKLFPLAGDSIAVYEPDLRLSMVWSVPDDDEDGLPHERVIPEWAETDSHDWGHLRRS